MPIQVSCQCGKYFNAPDRLAGKTVKCPGCGEPLPIPGQQASNSSIDLANLEAAAKEAHSSSSGIDLADLAAAAEQAHSSSSSGAGEKIAAATSGTGLTSSSLTMAIPKKEKATPPAALIILGIIAVICMVLIVILLVRGSGRESNSNADASRLNGRERQYDSSPALTSDDQGVDASAHDDDSPAGPDAGDGGDQAEPGAGSDSKPAEPPDPSIGEPRGGPPPDRANGRGRGHPGRQQNASATDNGSPDTNVPEPPTENVSTAIPENGAEPTGATKYLRPKMAKGLFDWYGGGNQLVASRQPKGAGVLELRYGWMVELLPHLGYQAEYGDLDFSKPWPAESNVPVVQKVIPEFLNPADDRRQYTGFRYSGLGLTHFVGMSGVEDGRNDVAAMLPRSDPRAGVFGYDEIARPDQITDGTSHTIMLIGSGKLAGPWAIAGGSTVRGARRPKETSYFDRMTGFGSLGHGKTGATVLMADGSVRWLDADMDPDVFRAMCTIHGSESGDLTELPFDHPSLQNVTARD